MFKTIINYLEPYKYAIIGWLTSLILAICLCFAIKSCSDAKSSAINNVKALTDSIEYYKSKSGDLVASKTLLEGDLSLLKIVNDSLYKVIKDMKVKDPSSVIYINSTIDNGTHDTAWVVQINDTIKTLPNIVKDFAFDNEYRKLEGNVYYTDSILGLNVYKDEVYFDYTLAIQNNKVYLKSNNPYIKYNEISGLTIPNRQKKWSIGIGPHIGYGYNFVAKKFDPYIGVGVQINYNILSW